MHILRPDFHSLADAALLLREGWLKIIVAVTVSFCPVYELACGSIYLSSAGPIHPCLTFAGHCRHLKQASYCRKALFTVRDPGTHPYKCGHTWLQFDEFYQFLFLRFFSLSETPKVMSSHVRDNPKTLSHARNNYQHNGTGKGYPSVRAGQRNQGRYVMPAQWWPAPGWYDLCPNPLVHCAPRRRSTGS